MVLLNAIIDIDDVVYQASIYIKFKNERVVLSYDCSLDIEHHRTDESMNKVLDKLNMNYQLMYRI